MKILLVFFMILVGGAVGKEQAPRIIGLYSTKNAKGYVEVKIAADGTLEAIGARGGSAQEFNDDNNPDPQLRGRSLLGVAIFWGLRPVNESKTEWTDGKIYDPDEGRTYSCRAILKGNELHVRGYVGRTMFGHTVVWKRVN